MLVALPLRSGFFECEPILPSVVPVDRAYALIRQQRLGSLQQKYPVSPVVA